MKHVTKSNKPVAKKQAAENLNVAPDPKAQLRELREQMKKLREEAKRTTQIHVAARSEQRLEVVDRWLGIYRQRRENAINRIAKIDEAIKTLEARREQLQERTAVTEAA